jgi:hypothetical protein
VRPVQYDNDVESRSTPRWVYDETVEDQRGDDADGDAGDAEPRVGKGVEDQSTSDLSVRIAYQAPRITEGARVARSPRHR